MRCIILAVVVGAVAWSVEAQKITPDGAVQSQVYWDGAGLQDAVSSGWAAEGSPAVVGPAFGYGAGGSGFTAGDFWYQASPSAWDFTAPECSMSPYVCGSPAFTAVVAFSTDGAVGTRFLLSDVTLGGGNGWYLSVSAPRKVQFRAFGLLGSENVYATDSQGLDVGTGLQVVCFGVDADLTPRLKANSRAMVSGAPGEWTNVCDPQYDIPECYSAFIPSYGPGFIGLHDGFDTAWRPAQWESFYEVYLTRTPITAELCESLEAQVRE